MPDPRTARRVRDAFPRLALLFPLALSAMAYRPILTAYFHDDDFLHIYHLANYDLLTNLLIPNGGHVLAVCNFVFFLCRHAFGLEPRGYYAVALITHLLNVALLFIAVRRLTSNPWLACFGATVWGTCPLHAGVLNWYSVYGQALAATTLLVILVQLAGAVRADRAPTRATLRGCYVLALLGTTCFGVGIGQALVLPWAIALLFPGRYRWWRPPLISLVVVVPLLYSALTLGYELRWVGADLHDARTSGELILATWPAWPVALWRVLSYGIVRLLAGPSWPASLFLPRLWDTIAGVVVAALLTVGLQDRRRTGRRLLGWALLALGAYGVIVIVRTPLILPTLFLAWQPAVFLATSRYHYVALIPVTMALCDGLARAIELWPQLRSWAAGAFAIWAGVWVAGMTVFPMRLDQADAARAASERFVTGIHAAAAAVPVGRAVYLRNRFFQPLSLAGPIFPKSAAAFTLFFPDGRVDDRSVYFVEADPAVRAATATGYPISRLLVAPAEVPAGATVQ